MARTVNIRFAPLTDLEKKSGAKRAGGDATSALVVFSGSDLAMSRATGKAVGPARKAIERAARAAKFKGSRNSVLDLLAPDGLDADRLLVAGISAKKKDDDKSAAKSANSARAAKSAKSAKVASPASKGEDKPADYAMLGGALMGKLGSGDMQVQVIFDLTEYDGTAAEAAAAFVLGLRLRAYSFETYKTKKKSAGNNGKNKNGDGKLDVTIHVADVAAAKKAGTAGEAVAAGVVAARDLVNEPANILFPEEFAKRARQLSKLGVKVEVLNVAAMKKLGMGALLGVGQGSEHQPRLVIMRWNGAGARTKPVAFVGKGVTFDTGGISLKPGGGMEDMKGDMAGAACVVGLMHALAARKAKANVIGAIGLVENMPDGRAQRPGDIVTTMSGQTVEVINTDAEGRLVLADVLWHVQDKFKPQFMINLATLTGAILVSLGNEYAGLFSNDDELCEKLSEVGEATGEKVWRLPLGPAYDKMIDSKFADMKNIGGRFAGSITAAQFLQRFVNDTPWAHLDIAGTGFGAPSSEINRSWGSGWGVRLLDRLVADHYEG